MRKVTAFVCLLVLAIVGMVPGAAAAPKQPADHGVMEPGSDGCPWPDEFNEFLEAEGVEKCLPGQIPWTHIEGFEETGIRIVSDPLVPAEGDAAGWVTFWCQFRVGLKYQIGVTGLEPHTEYAVTAEGFRFLPEFELVNWTLGTLRTDAHGGAVLNGVLRLSPGGYELDINVGGLSVPDDDLVGFLVLR